MRSGNKVAKIGEKMRHILTYNLYKNGDHRNKQSARGAVARGGPIFTLGTLFLHVPFVMETSGSMGTRAIKFLNRIMAAYPKSSPSSEGLLIGRLKERMAANVLKYTSYLVDT